MGKSDRPNLDPTAVDELELCFRGICVCVCFFLWGFCPLPQSGIAVAARRREDGIVARAGAPCLGGDGETMTDDKRVWAKHMVPRASAYPWAGVSLGVGDSVE